MAVLLSAGLLAVRSYLCVSEGSYCTYIKALVDGWKWKNKLRSFVYKIYTELFIFTDYRQHWLEFTFCFHKMLAFNFVTLEFWEENSTSPRK